MKKLLALFAFLLGWPLRLFDAVLRKLAGLRGMYCVDKESFFHGWNSLTALRDFAAEVSTWEVPRNRRAVRLQIKPRVQKDLAQAIGYLARSMR